MEVKFINKHLEELYSTGKSKKYKTVPADVIKKLPRAVIILEQIEIIQDIWKLIGPMKKNQLESLVWKI